VVNYYSGWDEPFNASFAQGAYADGIETFVEMEPWNCYSCDGDSVPAMTDIAAGGYDGYLTGFGQAIKAFGHPVLVTFAHEMNGGWYPWGYDGSEGTTPEQWIAAWDHVVTVVNGQAPGLVTWVWAANVELGATSVAQYWPGAQYVGEVGLDGYLSSDSDTYQSEFGQTVTDVRALTDRPIWITETGVNQDDSAGQRLADLAAAVKQAGLTGMLYFDQGPAALSTEEEQLLAGVIGPWMTSSPIPPVLSPAPTLLPTPATPPTATPPTATPSPTTASPSPSPDGSSVKNVSRPGAPRRCFRRRAQAAQQGRAPVGHQRPHDQRGLGAFDARDGEDRARDPVQVVGIAGRHPHQQVRGAAHAEDFEHLRDGGERRGHLVEPLLDDGHRDERGQRVAERRGLDPALEAGQHPLVVEPAEPRLHRVARQAHLLRQRQHRRARIPDQRQQQFRVGPVHSDTPHSAHLSPVPASGTEHIATLMGRWLRT
jgi:hypothetical protein